MRNIIFVKAGTFKDSDKVYFSSQCLFCRNCVDVSGTGEMGWNNWYCKFHEKNVHPDDTCEDFIYI